MGPSEGDSVGDGVSPVGDNVGDNDGDNVGENVGLNDGDSVLLIDWLMKQDGGDIKREIYTWRKIDSPQHKQ